ncbi:Peptidase_M20 domain-containing protein/M20_dimer domain-containing protein [Cephalotus follicularis]|uniref:allantoate deiminase n=1 Tax=Cephalotus follicularis TaxID=3775 RepID=A0A1Q3BMG3_CEPFO|nr:Peptidase_M20 domain-containing protein/M20_dimer domain-containing protein [Cephalotus follicularis]
MAVAYTKQHFSDYQNPKECLLILFVCFLVFSLLFTFASSTSMDSDVKNMLFPEILRDEAVTRLNDLGKVSDADGYLERTFRSPASVRAVDIIGGWMDEAGLRTWVDHMGNVHGRVEGMNTSVEALLIGSHLDTVVDAGKFDGSLGIISAISAMKVLKINGKMEKLKRPVEIIAFSDEEGVRFQSTFLGSAAVAGVLPSSALKISDKSGVTVQEALKKSSIDIEEESLFHLKYDPASVWGYIEVHIEQGPVLEWVGFPLGVVKGIAGQTRLKVTVGGSQGHAGTVPMSLRRDPMAAAAELIVLLENLCKNPKGYLSDFGHCNDSIMESLATSLVCTVGEISTWPSASNVIPGQVKFTVDLRAIDDMGREAVIFELSNQMYQICERRSVSCVIERKHDANAVMCDAELSSQLKSAAYTALKRMAGEIQDEVPVLMSGAGHDAMAISHLTKIGMLFVRCRGGVSHSPAEHVLDDDVWTAGLAVLAFLETHVNSENIHVQY